MADGEPELPETDEEWQQAVDLAHGFLAINSARQYGFITGGPACNVSRCEEVLALGRDRGFKPQAGAIEQTVKILRDRS